MSDLQSQLTKALDHLQETFSTFQTGRAHPSIVEGVEVEVYGSQTPIRSVANISCPDNQTLKVEPWDKSCIGDIERGINMANIGLNPQNMGEYILLPVPPLTEERRKQMAKLVHEESENARITIRTIRQQFNKDIQNQKENKDISEDEATKAGKDLQEKIDEANKKIDDLMRQKEASVLQP